MDTKKSQSMDVPAVDDRVLRVIQMNYESAIREIYSRSRWLRQAIDEAERLPDSAHTPGNIGGIAASLDAAREKAYTLRQTLEALGVPPPPIDERYEHVRKIARSGKKIEAIKLYRELSGVGLLEAKNWVEAL